ncbi:hypothetical protein ACRYCC_38085 [Actinomadura scrupuli]|uniref:hypothetical protein n=1 Tax=Actinomadura scrupuli TaxID=559629 RepID=UPI003D995246
MRTNRSCVLPAFLLIITLPISIFAGVLVLTRTNPLKEGDVVIGTAAPRGAGVTFPALKDGKILAANQWPDACSFVDEEEIKSIFPGVKDIEQERRWIHSVSIKDFAADPSWRESARSESGQCLYSMRLPGEVYHATQFWIRIESVADPALIAAYYRRVAPAVDTGQGSKGADQCAITGQAQGDWFCRKGPLLFTVGGQTTVTFKGRPAPAPWFWRDDVLPEFVQTITAKIK